MNEFLRDDILECNRQIKLINKKLKKQYLPLLEKCMTVQELRDKWQWMLEDLNLDSSDDIPGTFQIELFYQMDRVRQLEEKGGDND